MIIPVVSCANELRSTMKLTSHACTVFCLWSRRTLRGGAEFTRLALALSVSTSACATLEPGHAVQERENCAWQVCVRSSDGRADRTYYVTNAGPVPATVLLTFGELRNLRPPVPLSIERVVAPESTIQLVHLDVVTRGAPTAAEASVTIDLGASDTAADEEHLYGVRFGGAAPRRLIQGDSTAPRRTLEAYAMHWTSPCRKARRC